MGTSTGARGFEAALRRRVAEAVIADLEEEGIPPSAFAGERVDGFVDAAMDALEREGVVDRFFDVVREAAVARARKAEPPDAIETEEVVGIWRAGGPEIMARLASEAAVLSARSEYGMAAETLLTASYLDEYLREPYILSEMAGLYRSAAEAHGDSALAQKAACDALLETAREHACADLDYFEDEFPGRALTDGCPAFDAALDAARKGRGRKSPDPSDAAARAREAAERSAHGGALDRAAASKAPWR